MNLSTHFTLAEATKSDKGERLGLSNQPDQKQLQTMKHTAEGMERVRTLLGDSPIRVNSWFRSPEVNKVVGGVSTSQHAKGEAVDFTCAVFGSPLEIALKLRDHWNVIKYDQLIYEQTWVHISFVSGRLPRGQELTYQGAGKYVKGIV